MEKLVVLKSIGGEKVLHRTQEKIERMGNFVCVKPLCSDKDDAPRCVEKSEIKISRFVLDENGQDNVPPKSLKFDSYCFDCFDNEIDRDDF